MKPNGFLVISDVSKQIIYHSYRAEALSVDQRYSFVGREEILLVYFEKF